MADFAGKLQRLSERGAPVGVEELIERIEAELAGDPLIVVPKRRKGTVMTKTDQPVTSKGPGPRRGLGWAVAAFVTVLAVAGLFVLFSGDEDDVVNQETVPTATTAPAPVAISGWFLLDLRTGEQTPLAEPFGGVDPYWVASSPDGTKLFANTCCQPSDVAIIANVDGTDVRTLDPPGSLSYYWGRWSPDGTRIVYQARDGASDLEFGNLFVEDVGSGEQTQITDFETDLGRTSAAWSHLIPTFSGDGESVYFHLPRTEAANTEFDVWSVPVIGGEPTLVMENAAWWEPLPSEETSGAFVVPGANGYFGQSMMLVTSDEPRTLVEGDGAIGFLSASPDARRIVYVEGDTDDIHVVDVATGESSKVADGDGASWLDNDTLVVMPDTD